MEENTQVLVQSGLAITPSKMIELAISNNAGMDQLERLMAMQERWEENEAKKAFNVALAQFKSESIVVGKNGRVEYKDRNNNVTSYRHATLANVCNTIGPALSAYGLSIRWRTEQCEGGKIRVTCILAHSQGHSESVSLESTPDASGGKNSIQAVGSTVSYLQRYTVLAVTGTATEEQDDDGYGAGDRVDSGDSEQGEKAGNAGSSLPSCSTEKFDELSKDLMDDKDPAIIKRMGWKSLVQSGTKTAEHLIGMVSTKYVLSDSQIKTINGWEKKGSK